MSLDLYLVCKHCHSHVNKFDHGITHNVSPMWVEAGCHGELYDADGRRAGDTLESLNAAIDKMAREPDKFRALNSPNGWGNYDDALAFLQSWRDEVNHHQAYKIKVSR